MQFRFLAIMLLAFLLPVMANAQRNRNEKNRLTVFSPDKEPFYLVMNGERMNSDPMTNIRVEDIPYGTYKLEIEFKDPYTQLIRKEIEISRQGMNGGAVYRIGWQWHGKPVLQVASFAPLQGCMVVQYVSHKNNDNDGGKQAMAAYKFDIAKRTLRDISFDDTRLSTAKGIVYSNYLTSAQVLEVCRLFSYEQSRLDFAKYAYPQATDPQNYFLVNKAFTFSSSVDDLNKFLYGM